MYDPDVRVRVGATDIAGALGQQRDYFLSTQPRIVSVTRRGLGTFVAIEALSRREPPRRESYLLRRDGKGWTIVYDTLMARAIAAWVQYRSAKDPSAEKPDSRAIRAGEDAATRFRDAFAAGALPGAVPAERAPEAP
jgi:hypothetical protein